MMQPNQVEVITKDKRQDKVSTSYEKDVVMITPKSIIKKFQARTAKTSPRGKRGNILMFFLAFFSASSILEAL